MARLNAAGKRLYDEALKTGNPHRRMSVRVDELMTALIGKPWPDAEEADALDPAKVIRPVTPAPVTPPAVPAPAPAPVVEAPAPVEPAPELADPAPVVEIAAPVKPAPASGPAAVDTSAEITGIIDAYEGTPPDSATVETIGLTPGTVRALQAAGMNTVGEIRARADLATVEGIGAVKLAAIQKAIA